MSNDKNKVMAKGLNSADKGSFSDGLWSAAFVRGALLR